MCRASTGKTGRVITERSVDNVIIRAAVSTSRRNIWANMEVVPAVGQAANTTQAQ